MYLKTLTLRGFKSFASATTLTFEPGITAIVGPNGSGKSNIVDALSWVMGEQGVKSLRGGKMEDIIFAGTAGRPPLGRAEVQLTIDNTDQALPIDYSEVTISRTMFRNGGSEYAINGSTCRLLDVQELLSDTGMGREMHVIVGQGQLDAILNATPEQRRGFIEEAAGVLKHRRRKEKAERKLDATQANLARLSDLIAEIRRQLKPLGRQAEVARRAALVQSELRDAQSRLLADDLATAQASLEADVMAEAEHERLRVGAEAALQKARDDEAAAEAAAAEALPRLSEAQEAWYNLTALRERVASTLSIAAERVAHASDAQDQPVSMLDPEVLEAEAYAMRASEEALRGEIDTAADGLTQATAVREAAEREARAAESAYARALRAVADRREGLARLTGQVGALRSRLEARQTTHERLRLSLGDAEVRTAQAMTDYQAMEARIASLDVGQQGLDSAFDEAEAAWRAVRENIEGLRQKDMAAAQRVASLEARVEALTLSLGPDVSAQLTDSGTVAGIAGRLAAHITVEPGWEAAIAAALGPVAEAVVAADLEAARAAVDWLKSSNTGRAALLVRDVDDVEHLDAAPSGARWASSVVRADDSLSGAVRHALGGVVVVDGLADAVDTVTAHPQLTAVTRDGDVISTWQARGGAVGADSLLQAQAALRQTESDLEEARQAAEQVRAEMAAAVSLEAETRAHREEALAQLNESDAAMGALAEQLSAAKQKAVSAKAEAGRLQVALDEAEQGRAEDEASLAGLQQRLKAASADGPVGEPDPSAKDQTAQATGWAREKEMEARLALRTVEERATALAGRADALMASAEQERAKRTAAVERAERLRREAEVARSVQIGAEWLAGVVDEAVARAGEVKNQADAARLATQTALAQARAVTRDNAAGLQGLVDGAHRDEMARIEQRMRVEQLTEKALADLGLDAETLINDYGPDVPIPVPGEPDDEPSTKPYVRAEQAARLRRAQQDL
ncbi:MAG: chromosome segregation protein SMC, partial [Propionibacteriaceae bacterium]|nr:chromosome segregation protein SMC [Propionibacteriaceae bacterium]